MRAFSESNSGVLIRNTAGCSNTCDVHHTIRADVTGKRGVKGRREIKGNVSAAAIIRIYRAVEINVRSYNADAEGGAVSYVCNRVIS